MSFETYGVAQNEGKSKDIDFEAVNRYKVEAAGLQQRETVVGYVAAIIDLGTQELPDAENVFTGSAEDEAKAIKEFPNTYFKDGIDPDSRKPCRLKCYPQKPVQCVAVAVDFPDIIMDVSAAMGFESKPLPLRLYMGGQFYLEGSGMIIQRPTPLKVNKKLGDWSLDQKNLFHRMAVASKLIQANECFLPKRIDELLGKAFQFEAQVYFKEGKNGKSYYTEYVKFSTGLGRGQREPEKLTTPMLIQFNQANPEEAVKELRNHVVNTIKRATNYQGSVIQKQIETVRGGNKAQEAAPKQEASATTPATTVADDDFDDDVPF